MNKLTKITPVILTGLLALNSCEEKPAAEINDSELRIKENAPAQQVEFSPQLAPVISQLDTQGEYFSITNTDGDLEKFCKFLDDFVQTLRQEEEFSDISSQVILVEVMKELGLDNITAKGQSSLNKGDYYHNRTFYQTNGKRTGLLSLMGGSATPYIGPSFAPAGTDLLVEFEINFKQTKDLYQKLAKRMGMAEEAQMTLNQSLTQGAMNLGDILGKFNIRVAMMLDLQADSSWTDPDGTEYPGVEMAMRIDNAAWLWQEYGTDYEAMMTVEEKDGLKIINMGESTDTPMGEITPSLIVDIKNDRLWLVSDIAQLEKYRDDSPKLAGSENYLAAMDGIPAKGNALVYISHDFCQQLTMPLVSAIESSLSTNDYVGTYASTTESLLAPLVQWFNKSPHGYTWALANNSDGVLIAANSPMASKGVSVTNGIMASTLTTSVLFTGASTYKDEANKATCELNQEQMQKAIRSWQNIYDKPIGAPVDRDEIFGLNAIMDLPTCPVDNTAYILLDTIPEVGTCYATCPHGHAPESTEGW